MRLHANGSNRAVLEGLGEFSSLSRKMAWVTLFFTCYDEFDVLGWFPCENIHVCVRLHANGLNRAVSVCLGKFCALSRKTARRTLFCTCYDVFDVMGWFPRKNTQECARLHANGSNRAALEGLGEFSSLSRKTA